MPFLHLQLRPFRLRDMVFEQSLINCNLVSVVVSGHKKLCRPVTAYKLSETWRILCFATMNYGSLWLQKLCSFAQMVKNGQLNYMSALGMILF